MTTVNPVLAGCYPDPSVCRVGDTFYLANSSFSYYPGLPIHRSTDLETWELVGHALVDDSWLDVGDGDVSDGVWAPTLRHYDGKFYLIFPLALGRTGSGFYVTTAADAAGPWSTPVLLEGDGIDPSLFFDEDGRCWFTAVRDTDSPAATGPGEVWMREFDPASLSLVGDTHVLWHGAVAGAWIEAPHVYRRGDRYYLLGAEGGTESNHAVTAAAATSVTGPYRTDPRSPLLTHRHLGADSKIQNVGHADLVDGPDGRSWAVVLATRPIEGHHTLGRETYLVPVQWEDTGPVFAPGVGRLDEFDLAFARSSDQRDWVSLRGPVEVQHDGDDVLLRTSEQDLRSHRTPAFYALRQSSHHAVLTCTIDGRALGESRAGLAAFQNASHLLAAEVHLERGEPRLRVTQVRGGVAVDLAEIPLPDARTTLSLRALATQYTVEIDSGAGPREVAAISHIDLSTETAGGFVGVLLGAFAIGDASAEVRFEGLAYSNQLPLNLYDAVA